MQPLLLALAEGNAVDPVGHVINHPAPGFGPTDFWLWSGNVGNLLLSGVILLVGGIFVAGKIGTKHEAQGAEKFVTKGRFAQMIEVICVYLRETTVRPLLGARTDAFMPFLWTLFFFILVNNLLGLVPFVDLQHAVSSDLAHKHAAYLGGTATQSVYVTGILALITFLVVNLAGIRELGVGGYLKHLTGGAPWFIWPIMIPVEILGTFVKPFALAIRLFANMTAGHILVATLLIFAGQGIVSLAGADTSAGMRVVGGAVTLISIIAAVAIYFLELFVAFLQAFVFMFLTAVFISQLSHHHDHDHEHEHGHDDHHEHAHGHKPAHA